MSDSATTVIIRPEPSRALSAFYVNLGSAVVAGHFRQVGWDVFLWDAARDRPDPAELLQAADIFLLTGYIDDFSKVIELAADIHLHNPEATVVVGGPHVTLLGAKILDITQEFDVICIGDALAETERCLVELGFRRPGSPIMVTASGRDFDTLMPAYDLWDRSRYFGVLPVEFSRGCRHRCPFCTDPVLRPGLLTDQGFTVVDRLTRAADEGYTRARFVDSSLSSLGPPLVEMLRQLADRQLSISWGAFVYPSDVTPRLAQLLADAGCTAVFMGIESLAAEVITGKAHQKRHDKVGEAVRILHEQGIYVHANFIIGLPGETRQTVDETLTGIQACTFDSVGGGPFFLTPNSMFHRDAARFGIEILNERWQETQHLNFWEPAEYFRTKTLSHEEMRSLAGYFRRQCELLNIPWGLSDYPLLCWESLGGERSHLLDLWRADSTSLTKQEGLVVDVLREKRIADPIHDWSHDFLALAGKVAGGCE
ncbi:radical SAM superfamily enzyme YgiQ (UPF0313 family) [Catenulispora sp. GAS73]|uniref:B12-binding domain-containing radical SAM protein n=1 Tax=Catenulispora sp. GAS73 TaxID=3156269 RepID=UPI003517E61C